MTFQFSARLAARDFSVELSIEKGETLAVLGPNGAGKSTLIELIAGLQRADAGSSSLNGEFLFDLPSTWVPAHKRPIALLSQDPLLFPHLDVLANVAFGPRSSGASRRQSRSRAQYWLDTVGSGQLSSRRSHQLSGGESQRVAIARALARDPQLLLLDEPMAALDVTVAPMIRATLREVLHDRTTILVTHDALDALSLANQVLVVEAGRVVERGHTREVLERPQTHFAAAIAGLALVHGIGTPTGMRTVDGQHLATVHGHAALEGTPVIGAVRPADVRLSREVGSLPPNSGRGRVLEVEPRGDLVRVRFASLAADVRASVVADLDITTTSEVSWRVPPEALTVYAQRPVATSWLAGTA
jgi:molybdate transport system ATP-binding protein